MGTTIKPVFYTTKETANYTEHLAEDIKKALGRDADLLLDHPAIYIRVWRNNYNVMNGTWSIYVGETNDIIERTKEHWAAAKIPIEKRNLGNWQYHMIEDLDEIGNQVVPTVYFFGHKLFNKSMTLDIENKLIDFCYAMTTAHTYNGRTNAQGYYSGDDNLDDIFSMIWKILRNENKDLFLSEASIQKSAIYKASPNHKLTKDQKLAKQLIIDRTISAILNNQFGQLIFVEGEAGTGKTVLTSSAFYGILENELLKSLNLTSYMLINHDEQRNVYQNMARKLGYKENIVQNPTSFLKEHSILDSNKNTYLPDTNNIVDLVFVDEAHLLWNQNNQAFDTKYKEPQLDEIIKRSRVTVIMFDENQILHKSQIYAMNYISQKRNLAKSQGPNPLIGENNYIELKNQLRMNCSVDTMNWIDSITKKLEVSKLHLSGSKDIKGYEVKIFDNPKDLHQAIIGKANKDETQLSRVIATYDWQFIYGKKCPTNKYWQIDINGWTLPWNEQIYRMDLQNTLRQRQKKRYSSLDWAEKDYTINEAGSTFTIQGFDLAYAGVILGPSVCYDKTKNRIYFDEGERAWNEMKGQRKLPNGTLINVTNVISQHELRVLMTRATQGLFIYACNDELRDALKKSIK